MTFRHQAVPSALALLTLLAPALAQDKADAALKKELRSKEAAAKKDPEALFAVAKWAAEKALTADSKRLYEAVLKAKPDHAGANEALGNVRVEGKWMPKKDAEALASKAVAAEMLAKGLVEVDSVWVDKAHADDAKRGVFHHDGELVTRDEKLALLAGKVRHAETGELFDAKFADKAKAGLFPLAGDSWGDEAQADAYHADPAHPWLVRSKHATIVSQLPITKLRQYRGEVEAAWIRVRNVLGETPPGPQHRPVLIIAATQDEYIALGKQVGDESSCTSAFLMRVGAQARLPGLPEIRAGVCDGTGALGPYMTRHAAGMAYAHAKAREAGVDLPLWLLYGIGSLTSRFMNDGDAAHYARQDLQSGGVTNLKQFFRDFKLSADLDQAALRHNQFQPGLLLDYALQPDADKAVVAARTALTASLEKPSKGAGAKAIEQLEAALIAAQEQVAAHLQKRSRN